MLSDSFHRASPPWIIYGSAANSLPAADTANCMIDRTDGFTSFAIPAASQAEKISGATKLAAIKERRQRSSTVRERNANTARRDSRGETIVSGM